METVAAVGAKAPMPSLPRIGARPSLGLPLLILAGVAAVPGSGTAALTYEKDILPIFKKNCAKCHGGGKMKGGVSIEIADMKADVGRIIIPGDPRDSMIYEVLASPSIKNKMPPKGGPLDIKDIDKVRDWIKSGAAFRGDAKAKDDPASSGLGVKPLNATFTNKAGKKIEAALLRVEEKKAVLRLKNGQIYRYPVEQLSEASQKTVREFAEKQAE